MPIGINGSGTITGISAGGLPDATITQAELASGVAGTGPAFAASTTSVLTVSNNTFTKLQCNTEAFDTNSNYDNVTNYRFTPTVTGYYFIYGYCYGAGSTNTNLVEAVIYKNGSVVIGGSLYYNASAAYNSAQSNTNICVYMNGSTDYVELYGRVIGSGTLSIGQTSTGINTQFGGFLIRGV